MKILILYTYNKGLLSEFFQEFSEKLFKDGFEVINFYLKHKKTFFEQNGVSIYGDKRGGYIYNYKAIYNIIKESQPDVIISNFSYINPAVLFGKLLGVKRNIAWFHTAYGHTKPSRLKVLNKTIYLNLADVVLSNSKQLQQEMHTVYKVPKQRIHSIPFWTNIGNYHSNSDNLQITNNESVINIGCPGRLVTDKNHELVIRSIHQLHQKHPLKKIYLYIAGNGPYQNQLEQLVAKLGLKEQVVFLGLLNVDGMVEFYDAMDVIVLPSFHEAFGLVFIEAIALGVPVLVSNSFGSLDFIDKQKYPIEDFSFNPKDIRELIDKLEPYIENGGLESDYFRRIYDSTFKKDIIYNQIKSVILNQT